MEDAAAERINAGLKKDNELRTFQGITSEQVCTMFGGLQQSRVCSYKWDLQETSCPTGNTRSSCVHAMPFGSQCLWVIRYLPDG